MALAEIIQVKRLREDDYSEIFTLSSIPAGASFVLQVGAFTPVTGSISGNDVVFIIPSDVSLAAVGSYAYEIVMTVGGKTRTVVEGDWQVVTRRVV